MKRNLLYLFTLLCSLGLFVACSDDDDDPVIPTPEEPEVPVVDESWKDLSKTYKVAEHSITLTGVALTSAEKEVVVAATSATAASVSLKNVVPDAAEVSISATLAKSGETYSVNGNATVDDCKIVISGEIDASKKMTLAITRTLSSAVTGNLALLVTEAELYPEQAPGVMMPYVPVYWHAVTGDPATDAALETVGPMLGGLIAGKVSAVNATLSPEGVFNVNWTKLGETEPTGMPEFVAQLTNIYYTAKDGVIYVALDKSIVAMVGILGGALEQYGINVEQILALLTDMGGYYGLPIAYVEADGIITFKLAKEQLLAVLELAGPALVGSLPEEMQGFAQLLQALPMAQELELGLPFIKQ
ncbi:hypothetical protein [Parabacteroides sp. PF5-6]|uniref:hypothetical protein n=1 Tax=Parabacteroides sp. PF5-6 TaxID=1742403 RepID=UPI0024059143|nr:hypothetical protein [Parabacteroides sp. PF5-6]MDF9831667.1 hypothetical protein [Parabacteroides sp. PF5-6]